MPLRHNKPHQVAASAPTPDRSTNPAERMTRKWRDDLTNPGPLQKPNFNTIGRELLAVHYRVHALMFQAMMPGLRPAEIKRLKRQEGDARRQRRLLCSTIRQECRLRLDAWDHHRPYSNYPRSRRGTRHR